MVRGLTGFLVLATAGAALAADQSMVADARRGQEFFSEQRCVSCHTVSGTGPHDLARLSQF